MTFTSTSDKPCRNLADYLDATSGDGDMTVGARRALADGPGVVLVPPGMYRWNEVCIPDHVVLAGCGPSTIVCPYDPRRPVFDQAGVGAWSIRELVMRGGSDGLRIRDCWGYRVLGVTVEDFADCGIHVEHTRLTPDAAASCDGGVLDQLRCRRNGVAVRLDERAEYVSVTASAMFRNGIGCVIHAGNVRLADCNIAANRDGVLVRDKQNGSHGIISRCLLNHNARYALHAGEVRNGMIVDSCCMYYGELLIENAAGVTVSNSQLACSIKVRGEGVNTLQGNFIVEGDGPCELSSATLAHGNYTRHGPWRFNRLSVDARTIEEAR